MVDIKDKKLVDDGLLIGSFNVLDNKVNGKGGIRSDGISNAKIVANKIKEKKFDLVGLQELTSKYKKNMKKILNEYDFYGDYRYGNGLLENIPYNEGNHIVTNLKVDETKTYKLPWIDGIKNFKLGHNMPRIATLVDANKNNDKIIMINTHLDYFSKKIQVMQLREIRKIIDFCTEMGSVFLTGDFNMEPNADHFKRFMSLIDLKRVPIDDATWYGKNGDKKTEDCIFIPYNYDVIEAGVIHDDELIKTSDHRMVYAKVKRKY